MCGKIIVVAVALFFISTAACYGEENVIRLICETTHYTSASGKDLIDKPASGKELITVYYHEDGTATITKKDTAFTLTYHGTISDEEIYGELNKKPSYPYDQESLVINRYTGEFEVSQISKIQKLVYWWYGSCLPVTENKF
ncbi:MAG: hypothetical protein P4L79_06500 [Legionella sp.]|uniref:hypothetical protein n=1 Tax=Legionella sp. TaxID=459 RepID=UPI00284A36DD|nr:hypothetical protein [Legionella sp.]